MNDNQIKDSLELLTLIFDATDGIVASVKDDNKVTLSDAPNLLKAAMSAAPAITGINNIPNELAKMTDEQAEQVKSFIKRRFNYVSDLEIEIIYESLILHGIGIIQNLTRLYRKGGRS